jgi:hypothetical protein
MEEVHEAIDTLSSSQFSDIFNIDSSSNNSSDDDDDDDDDDKLERFGTGVLISEWRDNLVVFKRNMEHWIARSVEMAQEVRDSIVSISLEKNQVDIITTAVLKLLPLEEELKKLSINNDDTEGFNLFIDSLRWIMNFLTLLHQVDRDEHRWFNQLNSQVIK